MEVTLSAACFAAWPRAAFSSPNLVTGESAVHAKDPSDGDTGVRGDAVSGSYFRLRSRQDEVNALALSLRQGQPGDLRKLYPPYPHGQETQLAHLEQMPGLRKQIESLRYPLVREDSDLHAEEIAAAIGKTSHIRLVELTALSTGAGISTNRAILESLAFE